MSTKRLISVAALFLSAFSFLSLSQAWAAKPCDRDAGECRQQDSKVKNPEAVQGCFRTTTTTSGGQVTESLGQMTASQCSAKGGEVNDWRPDGGSGKRRVQVKP